MDITIINKIIYNINKTKKQILIASPSKEDPNYYYYWIRDSSLSIRPIIDIYYKTNDFKYFKYILNYIEFEYELLSLQTISGNGEPKVNVDGTAFNDSWGRPQNDGPAIRGYTMIIIYNIIKNQFPSLANKLVLPIIENDIKYICSVINTPCFDLWEEKYGWHFYTRLVQLKFIKEMIDFIKNNKNNININYNLDIILDENMDKINAHFLELDGNIKIVSNLKTDGSICKKHDSSIFLAFCHINFDKWFLNKINMKLCESTYNSLLNYFCKKYDNEENYMIGRYKNDNYFEGHVWHICILGFCQVLLKLHPNNNDIILFCKKVFNDIIKIDNDLNISEQYNVKTKEQISAKNLTWNYTELYYLYLNLKNHL